MRQAIKSVHLVDADGNPSGGYTNGVGLSISWQNGPLQRGVDRVQPNGAFVETVIESALDRLRWYQTTRFKCFENAAAIDALERGLEALEHRTADRERRGVEGTHVQ